MNNHMMIVWGCTCYGFYYWIANMVFENTFLAKGVHHCHQMMSTFDFFAIMPMMNAIFDVQLEQLCGNFVGNERFTCT
jgi:hypothetical protein